ncbi:MAG: BrnA antitoxin family protein [Sphingomicrobium sp.]
MRKSNKTRRELAALASLSDAAIDTSDVPEISDWRGGERGRFYRPVKQMVTIRLDADVIAWFKTRGGKYQTAVNRVLRDHMLGGSGSGTGRRSGAAEKRRRYSAKG